MIEEHGSKHISGLEVTDKPYRRKLGIFSISLATALAFMVIRQITTNLLSKHLRFLYKQ